MSLAGLLGNFNGGLKNNTSGLNLTFNFTFPNLRGMLSNTQNLSIDLTDFELVQTWGFEHIYPVLITTGACICILNLYILLMFKRKPVLRSKSNYFLLHLAVIDTINGIVCAPLFVTSEKAVETIRFSTLWQTMCVYSVSQIVQRAVNVSTIISVFLIITDRCLNVWFPFRYRRFKTCKNIRIVLIVAWLLPAAFTALAVPIYLPLLQFKELSTITDIVQFSLAVLKVSISLAKYKYKEIFFCILILFTILSSGSLSLTFSAIYRRPRTTTLNGMVCMTSNRRRKELKALRILGVMFCTILIWLVPTLYALIGGREKLQYVVFHIGRFFISITNPILFTVYKPDFRRAVYQDIVFVGKKIKCIPKNVSTNIVSPRRSKGDKSNIKSGCVTNVANNV